MIDCKIKLTLQLRLYKNNMVKFRIEQKPKQLKNLSVYKPIYTDESGYQIIADSYFSYNRNSLHLPINEPIDDTDNVSYFSFTSDEERYNSLKLLKNILEKFSQSRIFQYDNKGGYMVMFNDYWFLY